VDAFDFGTELVEELAAAVHARYVVTKFEQGIDSRLSETGEELMVPYQQLSEPAKDLDRNTVVTVLDALTRVRPDIYVKLVEEST
jgi:hypothetical protein